MALLTIPQYLIEHSKVRPTETALRYKKGENWQTVTWKEYTDLAMKTASALIKMGMGPGGKTCILGFNRVEWVVFDVGTMLAGGIPAGIYETCSPEEVAYILNHSEAVAVLVENKEQLAKVLSKKEELIYLKKIILMEGTESTENNVLSWGDFLKFGEDPNAIRQTGERINNLKEEEPATFIYTSGTTGPPKAVMLSNKNLVWTAKTATDMLGITSKETGFSYLPLSHVAEQMFTIHAPIIVGWSITFAENRDKVLENLKEVQPTIVFGVPRVWEKFYAGVNEKLKDAKGIKGKLVAWARTQGTSYHTQINSGIEPDIWTKKKYNIAKKLVFTKLKTALGMSNARFCVSGAAPISPEVLEFFASLDIPILEVYGQSEDSGPTSFNQPGKARYGSVGPMFPGMEVKIADDGEILAKGPNVFLGYYKDPETTAATLKDGWLYSGDLGRFDDDGFLWITGRKKDLIITSGGKNISPSNLEIALKNLPLVSQAIVIGDRRKFISALLTLNENVAQAFAKENNIQEKNLYKTPQIIEEIQNGIDGINATVARVEGIKKFRILPRDLTLADQELTPTLKVKRNVVCQNWAHLIDEMYA